MRREREGEDRHVRSGGRFAWAICRSTLLMQDMAPMQDEVEWQFRRPMHLDLPEDNDRNGQEAKVHGHMDDAEYRPQFAGGVTLWWAGELPGGNGVVTGPRQFALKDVQEKCSDSVNDKKTEKDPMCDHPSFLSEAGDAHVETRDGHLDDPYCHKENHPINRAELMKSISPL